MASTYPPNKAFDYAKRSVKNMPLDQIHIRILDDINKIMWMAAPWRWTIGTLSNITLTSNTQDYTQTPPADFLYMLHSYVSDGTSATKHLEILPTLPATEVVIGDPSQFAYVGSNTFRIYPKTGNLTSTAVPSPPTKQIVTYYKKTAPVIIPQNANTSGVLVMDDEWFWVYASGVLWLSYLWGDDTRAGSANIDLQGRVTYTGQRAIFEAGIAQMKMREPIPNFEFKVAQDQKAMDK